MVPASSFLSLAFSLSGTFSACRRLHSGLVLLQDAMICCSVCLLRFMVRSLKRPDSSSQSINPRGNVGKDREVSTSIFPPGAGHEIASSTRRRLVPCVTRIIQTRHVLDELRRSKSLWKPHQETLSPRTISAGSRSGQSSTIASISAGPRSRPRRGAGEALQLCPDAVSLSRQPREPVSRLCPLFLLASTTSGSRPCIARLISQRSRPLRRY